MEHDDEQAYGTDGEVVSGGEEEAEVLERIWRRAGGTNSSGNTQTGKF